MIDFENAKIIKTKLGYDCHGIFTFRIDVKTRNTENSIGGYELDYYSQKAGRRLFNAKSLTVISEILKVVGVDTWEQLLGEYIRIEKVSSTGTINWIKNIVRDEALNFKRAL
ncbi:hypothetical protein FACS1894105_04260 [Clostridia bacterium]|nr:hypothetical protein FACS1894105_04260 [Clostridia bacterium]